MITQSQIDAALRKGRASKKRIELRDMGARGAGRLTLVVRPLASRIVAEWYALQHRGGRRSITKIGAYPQIGLADARRQFREDYEPLIANGQSLSGRLARKATKSATVQEMFLGYVQHLETTARPRSARQARIILLGSRKGAGAAGAIGEHVLAADVKPSDIIPYLAAIHKRGSIVMARKARTYICAAFAFAMKSANSYTGKNGSGNWGVAINPGAAIPADRDAHRAGDRHLSVAEFRALWHWLESRDEISLTAPVLRLMMATGQRMEEILFLTDAQYDRTERLLDWSRTKNGQPHSIPLSPQAVTILDGLAVNRQGLFFPGRARDNAPLSMNAVEKELDRFIEKNGSQHFCPRDLRRTWKTLAGAAGLSKEIRDRLQNHARSDVSSRHYDRWTMLPEKRAAVAQWSEYLDWVLNGDLGEIEQGRGGQPVSLAEIRARREQAKAAA